MCGCWAEGMGGTAPFSWPRVLLIACYNAVLLFVVLMPSCITGRWAVGARRWRWVGVGPGGGSTPDPTPLRSVRCLPLRLSFLSFIAWCLAFPLGLDCAQGFVPGAVGMGRRSKRAFCAGRYLTPLYPN